MFRKEELKKHSTYNIGGYTPHFFAFRTIEEAGRALLEAEKIGKPIFILGGGTNILFSDHRFDGIVLKNTIQTIDVLTGYRLRVGGGVLVSKICDMAIERGWAGLEWAGGLPGTIGGAIRGNAGAFQGETKDVVFEVTSISVENGKFKIMRRTNEECKFAYRSSIFKMKHPEEIICEAVLQFRAGDKEAIRKAIEEKIEYRKNRQPIEFPNIGSIFKNIDVKNIPSSLHSKIAHVIKQDPFPVVPTAYLISEAGLKGVQKGGAMISPKHPNFIVNIGDASAEDVKYLIALVKKTLKEKFDVDVEEEIVYSEG